MKTFVVMFVVALAASTQGFDLKELLEERIVGGQPVDILNYPYQVSFQMREFHACGGSIISSRFILTAAHCTDILNQLPPGTVVDMWVRAGSSDYTKGGVRIGVKKYYQHPVYVNTSYDYDVTVLELESDLSFGPGIQKVNLAPLGAALPVGAKVKAVGWGKTETAENVDLLRGIEVTVIDQKSCVAVHAGTAAKISERMLCAGVKAGGIDTCTGDSGAALVTADGTQIGIVSFGIECGSARFPGVYVNVASRGIRDFIREKSGV